MNRELLHTLKLGLYLVRLMQRRLLIFIVVFRLRNRTGDPRLTERLWRAYWQGKEASTLKSYSSGYNSLRRVCQEEGLSVFRLDYLARCAICRNLVRVREP